MDLTALWNREKARLAAELKPAAPSYAVDRASFSSSLEEENPLTGLKGNNGRRVKASVSAASTMKPLPVTKKKSTVSCNVPRDRVFRLLVETSIAPSPTTTAPNFYGTNEFAMEYADRAVKRLSGNPELPQQQTLAPPAPTSNSANLSTANRGQTNRKASTRLNSVFALRSQNPSPQGQVAQSAVQNGVAFPVMTKPRKNGRKYAGMEYSSHAFKPYGGDMFSTRGEYIDGMLYMSRMKRSYHAMMSNGNKKIEFNGSGVPWGELSRSEGRSVLKDGVSDAFAVVSGGKVGGASGSRRTGSTIVVASPSEDDVDKQSTLTSVQRKRQQRCSLTLSNWSFNPDNARLMVQENVVEALIRLCEDGDNTTRLNCVTALMNLSHLCELRRVIVQQGAVKTVAEIVNDMEDKTIRTACAITLCNLCSLQGVEDLLVEDGAVSALSTLINEHEKVSHICRCALFNLTCVSQSYHKIESVLKAFIALTTTRNGGSNSGYLGRTEEEYDDITAKALCNLSNLKRTRLRLMEEGIVSAITSLLHPNIPLIQELLAHILLNLSRLPTCRSEMVAKGCMGTLVALAGASSAITTKCLIGITLWNLSKDAGNTVRMVLEGLLLLVNELCRDVRCVEDRIRDAGQDFIQEDNSSSEATKEEDLVQVCARTLYNVSYCEDSRVKLVERDAVNILSSLSRRSSGDEAKQMCTLALCNLLSVQKAAADIVTAGAITALIQLSMAPAQSYETRNLFSKALHGLCDKAPTRAAVTEAGVIPALLFLTSIDEVKADEATHANPIDLQSAGLLSEIRSRCTAAFACLAADAHTAIHVCNAAVVQCVTRILVLEHSNVTIERVCCSCLSLLCRDEQCSIIMVEVGAIEMVLATCVESHDQESKASCCHVLASVSCHPSCCAALVRMGVISVLATLAKTKENAVIQRCCATTLANLSVEPDIREMLASAGTVAIVSVLSNSYSEDSQRDCAKILCNLSCIRGNEAALVGEGAVAALMMISMVRAVSLSTKETCIRALLNLLNAETMKHMVKEGLVKILSVYAGLESKQVATLVTIIFGKLLSHPVGRNALCAEKSPLHALFQLMTYDSAAAQLDPEERRLASLHEKLLGELVYYENSRLLSVHIGILDALYRISMYEDHYSGAHEHDHHHHHSHCAEKTLALVFFTLAKSEDSRMAVAASSSLAILLKFLDLHAAKADCEASECAVYAAATLCWLGWHEDTRCFLQTSDIPRALTQMLQIHATGNDDVVDEKDGLLSYSSQAIKTCVLTLCCLTHSADLLEVMIKENVVVHLNGILTSSRRRIITNTPVVESNLSTDEEFIALACILFRQLSHNTCFTSSMVQQPAPILELFCTLVHHVVAKHDINSSLDCADAFCSIAFVPTLEPASVKGALTPGKERSPIPTPRPSQFLVEKSVLDAIGSLMTDEQLPESRWRCSASLWALSSVPEYRQKLVQLGVTPFLVGESYRAAKVNALNTLQCCAGALCNLTIVPGETNSAKMVEEGAMPALIQLAMLEHETIREDCTLALANLSGPSPKVESGSVSAVLNLSLDFTSSIPGSANTIPASRRGSKQQPVLLDRPPFVTGERHKEFAVLPNYAIEITAESSLDEQKLEAELATSTPPPPHLPTIAADLVGNISRSDNDNAPTKTTPASEHDEAAREYMQTRFFDKVDPEESLALMTGTDERESDEENTWTEVRTDEYSGNQEDEPQTDHFAAPSNPNQSDVPRLTDHHSRLLGAGSIKAPIYTLSPLSRVILRKTNAVQAARKFKDATTRKARKDGDVQKRSMLGSQSSPCLTKAPPTPDQRSTEHSASGKLVFKFPPQLLSLTGSTSTSSLPSSFELHDSINSRDALVAAVSAAGLYGTAPPRYHLDGVKTTISLNAKQQKKRVAMDRAKKEKEARLDSNVELLEAQPKSNASLTPASSFEEFQLQAKKLGLWS